ncbi:MAG: hypothetical protein FJ104_17405, partial [Deltaproteobacteria bacterium]|nr:hypothetical protein [Deltaproteobacteria bacterium]
AEGIERALELACAAAPEDAPLREQLVSRYLERSEWVLAARVLGRAARAHAEDTALVLRAVEAAEQGGDVAGAAELIGLAMRGDSADAELHAERARLLGDLGRHDEALRDIEAAHERGGGRTAELLRALEAAAERADDETRASHVLRLVGVLEAAGETAPARDHLVKLVRQQPKHRIALRRLAALAAIEARWEEAAATYRRLIPLEEGDACVAAALDLADACEHAGHLADARGGLELSLERVPTSAEVRVRLRRLYEDTQAHRELAALLLDEARVEPEVAARAATLVQAAELLLERVSDPAAAVRVLEEARRLSPESIPGAVLLARANASLGRSQEARTTLEEVVAAHRGRRTRELSSVYREIANLALESGQLRTALDSLSRAFDLDMRSGELAMQLGHLALDVGDDDAAQKAFRAVTMMKPRQVGSTEGSSPEAKAVAYYHLARIARAQGDVRKARLMISKAVSENPAHAEAQALLRELRAV